MQAIEGDDDILMATACEWVENKQIWELADCVRALGQFWSLMSASSPEEPEKGAILQEGDTVAGMLPLTAEAIANADAK